MTGVSKSQVSRLCSELDERVNAFRSRPATGLEFGFRIPAVRDGQLMADCVKPARGEADIASRR